MKTKFGRTLAGVLALLALAGCATEPPNAPKARSKGELAIAGTGHVPDLPQDLYASDEVEVKPQSLFAVPPSYPESLARHGVEGRVFLRVVVLADGSVGPIRTESSTRMEFEVPAIEAVRQWRFEPAIKDGKPVACVLRIPLTFSVNVK